MVMMMMMCFFLTESFLKVPMYSYSQWLEDYRARWRSIVTLVDEIPQIDEQAIKDMVSDKDLFIDFKPISSYSLRSNNKYLLSNPNFRTLPTLGDRAFVAAAPKLWNNLPLDLRCTSDFEVFKRNLKTHLFKKGFSDIMWYI